MVLLKNTCMSIFATPPFRAVLCILTNEGLLPKHRRVQLLGSKWQLTWSRGEEGSRR